jgi:hypothetical protein
MTVAIVNIFVNLSPTTMTFVIVVVGSHGLLSMLLHSSIKRESAESASSKCAEEEERMCNCESEKVQI